MGVSSKPSFRDEPELNAIRDLMIILEAVVIAAPEMGPEFCQHFVAAGAFEF
jgi:hypothetical protein